MAKPQKGRDRGGKGRSGSGRAARPQTNRHYPRTARLNALLLEIVAGHLERVDDERLGFITVTGVEVDNDLNKAEVFISTFEPMETLEAEADYLEALTEYRKAIKADIGRQARIRKTPELVFAFDPGVRAGARIEEILSSIERPADDEVVAETGKDTGEGGPADRGPADTDTGADTDPDADAGLDG